LRREEVEEKCADPRGVEYLSDCPIARTVSTTSTSMSEEDEPYRLLG
jgi:hypothetical protein